jgi:cerevisin
MIKALVITVFAAVAAADGLLFQDNGVKLSLAPLYAPRHPQKSASREYLVVLKDEQMDAFHESNPRLIRHRQWLMERMSSSQITSFEAEADVTSVVHQFFSIGEFAGYSGRFSQVMLDEIRSNSDVEFIEYDQIVRKYAALKTTVPTVSRPGAPWGLQRITQREKLYYGNPYSLNFNYTIQAKEQGYGSTVYVLDTGINVDHQELNNNARWGNNFAENSRNEDVDSHGTHCAGTVGGQRVGVANKAEIVAVKVLDDDGYGYDSWIIAGMEWVIKQHKKKVNDEIPARRTIVSMSLGGEFSRALNKALNNAVKHNVLFVVAAVNDNADACQDSPGSA